LEELVTAIFRAKEYAMQETSMKQVASSAGLLLGILFNPVDEDKFLQNVSQLSTD
jgi:hypothetical protein